MKYGVWTAGMQKMEEVIVLLQYWWSVELTVFKRKLAAIARDWRGKSRE